MKPTAVVLTPQSLDGGAGLGAGGVSIHSNDSAEGAPFILDIPRAWRGFWVVLLWRRWVSGFRQGALAGILIRLRSPGTWTDNRFGTLCWQGKMESSSLTFIPCYLRTEHP